MPVLEFTTKEKPPTSLLELYATPQITNIVGGKVKGSFIDQNDNQVEQDLDFTPKDPSSKINISNFQLE